MPTMETMHGDCPTLPEAATELMSTTPMCSSPLVDRKPVTVEIIDDDENDLSIENPTESEEKPSDFNSSSGGPVNRKRKWSTADELGNIVWKYEAAKPQHCNFEEEESDDQLGSMCDM
ncbi:hypothetical protein TELCIR_26330 [Teladorsagia circumcincta]|uniref:Uncharacterized protein n=1 Tax=Teladorsagia circumcincta TaxID=45464 RepID=A0A2G9T362_TELCI|nr:hypothetical protein TELCIR_26330 [Teladorsagia circumcincta]